MGGRTGHAPISVIRACDWHGWRGASAGPVGSNPSFVFACHLFSRLALRFAACATDRPFPAFTPLRYRRPDLATPTWGARPPSAGADSLGCYYLSLQLSNLIVSSVSACLLTVPVYALVGLSATWSQAGYFVLVLALMSLIGSSLGVIVGATTSDIDSARSAIMPTLVPLLIFSGYLIPYDKISSWFKWAYYASFFQWGAPLAAASSRCSACTEHTCSNLLSVRSPALATSRHTDQAPWC